MKTGAYYLTPNAEGRASRGRLEGLGASDLACHCGEKPHQAPPSDHGVLSRGGGEELPAAQWSVMDSNRNRVGAVVIGGDYQGLGIVQSLGRHGVPVCIVDDEPSIAKFSRYATCAVMLPDLRDERATVDAVLAAGRRLGLKGWVLYPTRDEMVAALSHYRHLLTEYFRVPTPKWATIRWAWDKRNTYRLAEELGIPVPRTWYPANVDEVRTIDVDFPVVIKPAIKEHFVYATKSKAWRASDRAELEELFLRAKKQVGQGEIMIQESVPGDGRQQFAYCAFFKQGHAVGSMVVRRTRQHPSEFGRASTFVETIELPLLETLSKRFLCAIDYYGLAELEYKLDLRDGQYKLLDVNARTWGYHTIGPCAGVDFSYLLFADQLGGAVQLCRGRSGVGWMRLVTDIPTAICDILAGRLPWRAYLQSPRKFHVEAVFSREDPLPGLVELALIPFLLAKRGF